MKTLKTKRKAGRPPKYAAGMAPPSLTIRLTDEVRGQLAAAQRLTGASRSRILNESMMAGGLRAYVVTTLKAFAVERAKDLETLAIKPEEIWGNMKAV